jgi:hypothetical protein
MIGALLPNGNPCIVSGCTIGPLGTSFSGRHGCGIEPQGVVGSICIFNNIIHDSPEISLSIGGEPGIGLAWIYNNIIYNSVPSPIVLDGRYASANVVFIYNNILDATMQGGNACIRSDVPWTFGDVENNLMIAGTDTSSYATYISSNNVMVASSVGTSLLGQSTNGIPYFSQVTGATLMGGMAGNLVAATNLSMLSTNVAASEVFTNDFFGVPRPASGSWDVGPFRLRAYLTPPTNLRIISAN